jgi:hypothetical protein
MSQAELQGRVKIAPVLAIGREVITPQYAGKRFAQHGHENL